MVWFAPFLYVCFAALAILLPESHFPADQYLVREHFRSFPGGYVVCLIALWTVSLIPWIVVTARRGESWPWQVIVAPLAVVIAMAIWARPPFTQDIQVNVGYGREVVVYGVSPYKVPLAAFERDPVIGFVARTWYFLTCMYGPLALGIFCIANFLFPSSSLIGLVRAQKALWLLPFAALGRLFRLRWTGLRQCNAMTLAVFANPVLLVYVFLEGHVDIVFLFFLILAGLALERLAPIPASLLLCAATAIKLSSIVVVPACACWLFRRDRKKGLTFFGLFLVAYGLCSFAIDAGDLRSTLGYFALSQFVHPHSTLPQALHFFGVTDFPVLRTVSDLCFFVLIGLLCLANLMGRGKSSPFATMAISMAALYFTRAYCQPWYTLWFWPLLWCTVKRPRELYISVALWTLPMILSFAPWLTWRYAPWLTLAGFVASLVWVHREEPTVEPARPARTSSPNSM